MVQEGTLRLFKVQPEVDLCNLSFTYNQAGLSMSTVSPIAATIS